MKDIFISYKSEEYNTAKWVRDYFEKCGLSVWMAPEDIHGGGSYAEYIPDAIENCKAFVLILSEKAQNSKWVTRELDQAINENKEILPFMIEKVELNKAFRFYLANIQAYPAYSDIRGQLEIMTREILSIEGITVNKPEVKKPVPAVQPKPQPKPQPDEPDFSGHRFLNESQKIRFAVNTAKTIYENIESTDEERAKAFEYLRWAAWKNDAEGSFHFGRNMLLGKIRIKEANSHERGMYYMERAARLGYPGAQKELDNFCNFRYRRLVGDKIPVQAPAPLRDFDNWKVKIKHTGKIPVNAVLDFVGGMNTLWLTANVNIMIDDDEVADWGRMEKAITDGMKAWEGVYTVFGGQKLAVVVDVNICERFLGTINIMSARGDMARNVLKIMGNLGGVVKQRGENAFTNYHTFSTVGMKAWSVKSNKSIMLYDGTGRFDDYEQIKRDIRCEFGSMLGLGNMLLTDNGKELFIPKGTHPELDPYYIENGRYNLVMCNGRGVISNNDIEMVVLALSENKMQYYLEDSHGNKPSKALGKGN